MRTEQKGHLNRTGMALDPGLSASLIKATSGTRPSAKGSAQGLAQVRIDYARSSEPVGTVPPPASMKGLVKTAAKAVQGKKATVLLDKLGERLGFERSGVRLYDALISKLEAYGSWENGPSLADLREIREEERQHYLLLRGAIEEMGGDPSAVTPSANVAAVASEGLPAVLADPRTDLKDGLEAILIAELVDNDCWETLIDLARSLGNEELAAAGEQALDAERRHLRRVRRWLGAAMSQAATGTMSAPFAAREAQHLQEDRVRRQGGDGANQEPEPRRRATRSTRATARRRSRVTGPRKQRTRAKGQTAGRKPSRRQKRVGRPSRASRTR